MAAALTGVLGEKSIEKLRADVVVAQEHLRQARDELDPTLTKDEKLFLLQPFAAEVHRAQEALWQRLPPEELEAELERRRDALRALEPYDPRRSQTMVAVSDLDRFLHPRRPKAPPAPSANRRWIVAGVAAIVVVAVVAAVLRSAGE